MRYAYEFNGKPVPKEQGKALAVAASLSMRERAERTRTHRRLERIENYAPERASVSRAMLAVEIRLVKAFWTIARQPGAGGSSLGQCGITYLHERSDVDARYTDAAGGKWESIAPRPSLPSSKEIDDANQALDWLLLVHDEILRKLLVVGATNKRGDAGRNISWPRIRQTMPDLAGYTTRMLRMKYREALRIIVNELTMARFAA